jgi:hypothetical protein
MTGFQQTRTSSAQQLTRRTVFASAGLVAASTAGGALQNVFAAERTDCIVMERSARVVSLLQAERTAFAAVAAVERQVSTQLSRPPARPRLCKDTDTIDGLKEKISYDEENLANWRRSRIPEIKRFADAAGIKTASTLMGISEEATPLHAPPHGGAFFCSQLVKIRSGFHLGQTSTGLGASQFAASFAMSVEVVWALQAAEELNCIISGPFVRLAIPRSAYHRSGPGRARLGAPAALPLSQTSICPNSCRGRRVLSGHYFQNPCACSGR